MYKLHSDIIECHRRFHARQAERRWAKLHLEVIGDCLICLTCRKETKIMSTINRHRHYPDCPYAV